MVHVNKATVSQLIIFEARAPTEREPVWTALTRTVSHTPTKEREARVARCAQVHEVRGNADLLNNHAARTLVFWYAPKTAWSFEAVNSGMIISQLLPYYQDSA